MPPENSIILEICLDSVESAIAAERGGAGRVELCADLLEGGITPSAGLISAVRSRISIGLQVMIRPRGGDFCYTVEEFEVMRQDILTAKRLGADGVVFGILEADGSVDVQRIRQLVDVARPLNVTHHRAFDMASDLFRALDDIISTGADRILTSGGEATVAAGLPVIKRLVEAAKGRIVILPGGGITGNDVRHIVEQTGVREIHAGVDSTLPSPMRFRNEKIAMGSVEGYEYRRTVLLQKGVEELLKAAEGKS